MKIEDSKAESPPALGSDPVFSRRMIARLVAYCGVIFPLVMGSVVLVGWMFELPYLTTIVPGFAAMKPNAAVGFLLAALSLAMLLRTTKARIVSGKILALLVFALGVATTAEYVLGADFGIDTLLVGDSLVEAANAFPARMSPFTAFGFLATGVGLWFLAGRRRSTVAISQVAILTAMLTALLGLIGYAYGTNTLLRIGQSSFMAIHAAFAFLVLGCGALAATPERGLTSLLTRGTSGSVLARRMLPAAVVIPLVLGWLRVKGDPAGYYDLPLGTALLVTSLMVIFVALVWRAALSLDRSDLTRQGTENALRESEAAKSAILASALDCIIAMDRQGRVTEWNPAATKTFGYSREDAIGKPLADLIIPVRFREAHWRGLARFLEMDEGPLLGKRIEVPALHSDGSEFPSELSILVSRGNDLFFTAYLRDITERKKTEGELAEKARLLDLTNDAVVVRDKANRVIFWNQGAEMLYGWPAEEASGKDLHYLLQTEFLQPIEEIVAELHREGKYTGEVIQVARDGQRVPSLCRWVLDRETESTLTSYTDMSALKRAEEALGASERKYRTLFEAMDEGYCIIEMLFDEEGQANDWRYLDVNAAFERHNGFSGAVGKRMRELVPDIESKWFEIYGKVALTGEPIRFVEHSAALNRWFDLYAYRVNGSETRQVAVLFTDITDRKRWEESLLANEHRMRLATEATGVGIWEWNVITERIRWDAQMFRLYGIEPAVDGFVSYDTWSRAVLPEDLAVQEEVLQNTVRRCGNSHREFRIVRADDQKCRWIQAVETVRSNERGNAEWVIGTNLDVTAQKNAERAILESSEKAVAANAAKDRFLAALSHELRTPLTPVLLLSGVHAESEAVAEDLREVFAMIHRNIVLEAQLIDDLLDVSRIQQGKMRFDFKSVNVNEVIAHALEMLRSEVEEKEIKVEQELCSAPAVIQADPARLLQVLSNLLRNAVKFNSRGGTITMRTACDKNALQISVTDTGAGIATEDLERIFQPFEQVDAQQKSADRSLGLGLAISGAIVAAHRGRIWAESPGPGQGTTFHLRLPF